MIHLKSRGVLACLATALLVSVIGLTDRAVLSADAPAADAKPAAKERAKPKGRLPPFYNKVVDETQKAAIYKIQDSYSAQIDELEAKLKALNDKQDAEIDALLTPAQREKVAALAAEAKARLAAAKKAASETAAAEAKPAK